MKIKTLIILFVLSSLNSSYSQHLVWRIEKDGKVDYVGQDQCKGSGCELVKIKILDKSVPKDFVDSLCELRLKSIPEAHYNSADLQPIGDRINGIFLNVTDMYVAKICGENIPVFSIMLLSLDDADSGKMPLCEPGIYGLYTKKYGFLYFTLVSEFESLAGTVAYTLMSNDKGESRRLEKLLKMSYNALK